VRQRLRHSAQGGAHNPALMAEVLGSFRGALRTFRGGLAAWRGDVLDIVASTRAGFGELRRELEGFVGMVMPLPHVDAPLKLDTSRLSAQQVYDDVTICNRI